MARAAGAKLAFIATAQACDDEMARRIARHRAEREAAFFTIEEPIDLAGALRGAGNYEGIVVDCLTLWLSNLMMGEHDIQAAAENAIAAALSAPSRVIVVTNEVGCGIVPENALARRFRDEAGWLNQRFGEAADEVYWMVFGNALRVK